jgi:hypothetical protein
VNNSLGFYNVNGKYFTSKMLAFLHATDLESKNIPVEFNKNLSLYYHDEIWDTAILKYNHENDISLEEHYKTRAQQIRDNYDYLILNFSGGSDSTTILDTFLKNNIKLDEVYVRWPKRILGSGLYRPDNTNTDPTNMVSEWDYSIYPKLEWLRVNHPEIKIVVDDWIDLMNDCVIDDELIKKQNNNFGIINFGFSEMISQSAIFLESKGKKVANIFGVDKPLLLYVPETKQYATFFTDVTLMNPGIQHAHNKIDVSNRVNFYYALDYPELTLARAYAVAKHIKNNNLSQLIDRNIRNVCNEEQTKFLRDTYRKLADKICYPNWNMNTFQVEKDTNVNKIYHPWFDYIYKSQEFEGKQNKLKKTLYDISYGIKDKFKNKDQNNLMVGLKTVSTKLFYLK